MFNIFKRKEIMVRPRLGKVFYVTDRGHILPASELKRHEIAKSKQVIAEETSWLENSGLKERRYSVTPLRELYDNNLQFKQATKQIGIDVAGLGWQVELIEGKKESQEEFDKISALIAKPNSDGDSFRDICEAWASDRAVMGDCAWQVVRSADEMVAEISLLSTELVKVYKDKTKYCQLSGTNKLWFATYGLRDGNGRLISLDPATGLEKALDMRERANELIWSKNRDPFNQYYGLSDAYCVLKQIVTANGICDYNLSFFINYGVPAYMVTLVGDWEEGSEKIIRDFLDTEIRGSENANKTFVARVPQGVDPEGKIQQGTIEFKPLSVATKEGSFHVYYKLMRQDIFSAFSVPLYRVGINETGSLGGTSNTDADERYKQAVIKPMQETLQTIITFLIFKEGLKCESYKFKFSEMDTTDEAALAQRHQLYFNMGAITPNQIRNELGEDPYDGGDVYYRPSNMVEVGYEEPRE